jgi:hypothetical protein
MGLKPNAINGLAFSHVRLWVTSRLQNWCRLYQASSPDAMQGIMPEKVRRRRSKIGFNSPMIEWYNGGMAEMLRKIVNHRLWLESPFWDGHQLRDYVLEKTNAGAWTSSDWGVTLHIWNRVNIVLWQLCLSKETYQKLDKSKNHYEILQIHTFYQLYLTEFYERNSQLASATFDEQLRPWCRMALPRAISSLLS